MMPNQSFVIEGGHPGVSEPDLTGAGLVDEVWNPEGRFIDGPALVGLGTESDGLESVV